MAANCSPQVATVETRVVDELGEPLTPDAEGIGAVVLERLGQLFCGIQGHEHMLQSTDARIFLRCVTCGHESPGWDVPIRLRAAKVQTPRARRLPPLPEKRVA